MENLAARDANAVQVSLEMVEKADVYLCILAYRYGFEPPVSDISITEMEYNHAVKLKKPRLVFLIHEDHPVTGKDFETGPGAVKLQRFKDRIGIERVAAFFTSPEDLRGHIVEALTKLQRQMAEEAGEDSSEVAAAKINRAVTIPAPPEPFVAHPYVLMQARDLVGRQAELNILTDWVTDASTEISRARIVNLVAIGGMGKSALAWKWFHKIAPNKIAPNEMAPLAGRLWWSFYESDAGFENFLDKALIYTGGASEEEIRDLGWHDKELRLLQVLDREPHLFVLDGFERVLIAYHRMDAAHLADDQLDKETANHVAGAYDLPTTAGQSFVGQHRLRQTTDPRAGAFLRKLAQVRAARILITTRLYPSALQLPTGGPRPGCYAYFLRGLSEDDAVGLWRALGVSGSRIELRPIFRSVENHPLLIQALASEVATYRPAPGDFARWRADHPDFDPTSLPLQQSRTHILHFALQGLTTALRQVTETVAAFRMPASYETLAALLIGPDKPCGDAGALDAALTDLEDRGLIGWDRQANRYDAHPIVRGVVWRLAGKDDQQAVLQALDAHFEPMATPNWLEVESLADLAPAIERYNTLIGLGRFDDAFQLFCDRLNQAALYRLAAHRHRIEWLERLFPDGVEQPPALASELDQAYALSALAPGYEFMGEPGRAVHLYRRAAEIYEREKDNTGISSALSNLAISLTQSGSLREAEYTGRRSLELSRTLNDYFNEAVGPVMVGRNATFLGKQNRSQQALELSRDLLKAQNHQQFEGVVTALLAERAFLFDGFAEAKQHADAAWRLAGVERVERDFIHAALLQGQAALKLSDLGLADERLHHALTRARAVNLVEIELPALIALARLALAHGDATAARAHLADVWEPAERGPYPLRQADAFNTLAEIERTEGNITAAVEAATKAYNAAWCDGPPWAYHWGLEAARSHLRELGAPEPELPPFDETKFEPLPDVPIIPPEED